MNPSDIWIKENLETEFFNPHVEDFEKAFHYFYQPNSSTIITIGGTNGKGECSRSLAHLFKQNNYTYCLWTSPHLKTVRERIASEKGLITDSEALVFFESTKKICQEKKWVLSFYEFLFICFLQFAQKRNPQFLILEVGMGGRLDAVNKLDADLCAITSISRDHQEYLGPTLRHILREKLGITRAHKTLLTTFELAYLRKLTQKHCLEHQVNWTDLFEKGHLKSQDSFTRRNQYLSAQMYQILTGGKDGIEELIKDNFVQSTEYHAGQWQNNYWEIRGTHNVDGMRKLVHFLYDETYNKKERKNYQYMLLSFSQRSMKEMEVMIKVLKSHPCLFDNLFLYIGRFHKAASEESIQYLGRKFALPVVDDWKKLLQGNSGQRILFLGSNYFVGHLLHELEY